MKTTFKGAGFILLVITLCSLLFTSVTAETLSVDDHKLTLELPETFTEINSENAEDNTDIITGFGYTEDSFCSYLEKENIILFATDQNGRQISLKAWESDFSKKTGDLYPVDNETLNGIRDQLVGTDYDRVKIAEVNSMKLFEVTKNDEDSGGEFCSVQYVTVRNGKIYSLTVTDSGSLTDAKADFAWDLVCGMEIEDTLSDTGWGISDIIFMIFIWLLIVVAIVAVAIIVYSFIKDAVKKKNSSYTGADFIERRK